LPGAGTVVFHFGVHKSVVQLIADLNHLRHTAGTGECLKRIFREIIQCGIFNKICGNISLLDNI
jgi:hypothetical protein